MGWNGHHQVKMSRKAIKDFLDNSRTCAGTTPEGHHTFTYPERSWLATAPSLEVGVAEYVYYAACTTIVSPTDDPDDDVRTTWAAVTLVSYDGVELLYKELSEASAFDTQGCPKAILRHLTPTTDPDALAWRERVAGKALAVVRA